MRTLEDIKTKTELTFDLNSGELVFAKTNDGELVVFSKTVLADEKTKTPISWYAHDVFKRGKMHGILRKHTRYKYPWGKITTYRVIVNTESLYDQEKLTELYTSEAFQKKNFAFFRYAVVEKLLGKELNQPLQAMSGLFAGAK